MGDDTDGSAEMLDSRWPFQFHLRLDAHDYGKKVFEESGEFNCQHHMGSAIAFAIARSLSCLNNPPSSADMLEAIESHSGGQGLLAAVGYAVARCWTGCCNLEKAVSVRIDIDKLMEDEAGEKKELSAKVLRGMGVEIIRSE